MRKLRIGNQSLSVSDSNCNSLRDARIVILDADGTLRRLPDGRTLEGREAFETFLRLPQFLDVLVVATGDWKRYLGLVGVREIFSEDIRARIVDVTPEIENTDEFRDHVENNAWLAEHPEIARFAVVEYSGQAPLSPETECGAFVHTGEVFSEAEFGKLARLLKTPATGSTSTQ
jgi:hypothetical protein